MYHTNLHFLLYSAINSFLFIFTNGMGNVFTAIVLFGAVFSIACYVYFSHNKAHHESWQEWLNGDYDKHDRYANELISSYFQQR